MAAADSPPTAATSSSSCLRSVKHAYGRFQRQQKNLLHQLFKQLGLLIGSYPVAWLIASVVFAIVCGVGMLRIKEVNNIRQQFTPDDARSKVEYEVMRENLISRGAPFYLRIILTADDGGSLLRDPYVDSVTDVESFLKSNVTMRLAGANHSSTFADLCHPQCGANSAVHIFFRSFKTMRNLRSANVDLTYRTTRLFGENVYVANHLFGVTRRNDSNVVERVEVVALHFRASSSDDDEKRLLQLWEDEVFRLVKHNTLFAQLRLTVWSERFVSLEVKRGAMDVLPYLILSFALILAFTLLTTWRRDPAERVHWATTAGVVCPLVSVVAAFGLLLHLGTNYVPMVTVVPFLVLAIGVDDMFMTVYAWHRAPKSLSGARRLASAMADAGPGITITSATNAVSFFLGTLSSTYAIRIFCLYAATAVLVGYFYNLFFFCPILVLTSKSNKKNTYYVSNGVVPAEQMLEIKRPAEVANTGNSKWIELTNKLVELAARAIVHPATRVVITLLLVVYWAGALYGFSLSERHVWEESKVWPSDSILNENSRLANEVLDRENAELYVFVNNPGDLQAAGRVQQVYDLVHAFETTNYSVGEEGTACWLRHYQAFLSYFDFEVDPSPDWFYYELMPDFLDMHQYVQWRPFIMQLDEAACLNNSAACFKSFMFTIAYANATDWRARTDMLYEWRALADSFAPLNVSVFDHRAMYVDQFESVRVATRKTIKIAVVCMAAICALMVPSVTSVAAAAVSCFSINLGVIGYLAHWGIGLDPISMSTILMSIGFSIDFVAHTSYHFYKADCERAVDRLAYTYRSSAWPQLQAGISTLLSVSALAFVESYTTLAFVKTVVLVIGLGLSHGLVCLLVYLAMFDASTWPCGAPKPSAAALDGHSPRASAGQVADIISAQLQPAKQS